MALIVVGAVIGSFALSAFGTARASANGTLTVAVQGKGDVSGPASDGSEGGINCSESGGPGTDCSEFYADECEPNPDPPPAQFCFPQTVTVTAANRPGTGYSFSSWSGPCVATGPSCDVTMSTSRSVTATFVDTQAPSVGGLTPSGGIQSGTIALGATASDNAGVSRVEFRVRGVLVNSDTTAPYGVNFNTTSVSDGPATVRADAFDAAGNSSFAGTSITIDNTAPTLSITSGPDGQTYGGGTTQTWAFSATDSPGSGIASVQCSVAATGSAASYGPCSGGNSSHSVTNQPGGSYTFSVRATDNAGRQTVATRSFAIDTAPPETTITGGPAEGSSQASNSATFTFASSEANSTFVCRVYAAGTTGPSFEACSGDGSHTAAGLSPGTYVFQVRATDGLGNVDASPASRTFTVAAPPPAGGNGTGGTGGGTTPRDTTPPDTEIDSGPKRKTTDKKKAKFVFSATEAGSSFECKLDKGGFEPCASPAKFKVKLGKHKLQVRAIDAAGNADPSPATYSWKAKGPATS